MKASFLISRVWRALKAVWRYDICRLQPLGMVNGCYLRPKLPSPQALHRQLWWRTRYKLPVLLWLPLELWRWIYWQILAAPRKIKSAVLKYGPDVEARHGIALEDQRRCIGYWAKSWSISPGYGYYLGLFRNESDALNMVLSAEMQPYHRLMNETRGASPVDYRMLFDKSLLSGCLAKAGVPVVPDIAESDGNMADLRKATASGGPVFCKLRAGSRGESAFMAESGLSGLFGQTLTGKTLANEAEVIAAWQTLTAKGEVLIQPYLRNHPILQQLSPDTEAMTLRVITRAHDAGFSVWSGFLYVQAPGAAIDRWYWMMKIDAFTGQAFDAFGHWLDDEQDADDSPQLLMLGGQAIPYWQDIAKHSQRAHAELPRLWTIAWDWIVTPDGPVLLEGNAGWDLSVLQELGVDFVKIGCEITENAHGK